MTGTHPVAARPRHRSHFPGDGVSITELARHLAVAVRTLRYYEEAGLLRPDRTPGNARVYGPWARAQAERVLTAADLGLDREAIREILLAEEPRASRLLAERLQEGLDALDARRARLAGALARLTSSTDGEPAPKASVPDDRQDRGALSVP